MRITIIQAMNEHALLAATLALMTHFAKSRCPYGAQKICENLLQLSVRANMPWEFRAVVAKLGAKWALLQEEARLPAGPAVVRH